MADFTSMGFWQSRLRVLELALVAGLVRRGRFATLRPPHCARSWIDLGCRLIEILYTGPGRESSAITNLSGAGYSARSSQTADISDKLYSLQSGAAPGPQWVQAQTLVG